MVAVRCNNPKDFVTGSIRYDVTALAPATLILHQRREFGFMTYIYKVKINRKYLFKKMKVGETFRLKDEDVRGAQ